MASIEYWDAESLSMKDSKDEYREVGRIVGLEIREGSFDSFHVDLTLYLHEPTGLVAHDLAAFEKWIDGVGK